MSAHFSDRSLKFLASLKRHNQREWFQPRKAIYEQELKTPLLDVIGEVNAAMQRFAPEHVRDPARCAMRIYRDIRFSKNKLPYKTNVAAWWARSGLEKTSGGGFYFELNTEGITCAAGVYLPDKEQTLAIRRMLLERHAEYRKLIAAKALRTAALVEFDGLRMTRAPKGFPAHHAADDLLRQRQWGVAAHLPVAAALGPDLVRQITACFKAAAPLVNLLNSPLLPAPRRPLF